MQTSISLKWKPNLLHVHQDGFTCMLDSCSCSKRKSKCCNCCHEDWQTIDKEKAKAVLVGILDSKKVCFPWILPTILNFSSTCCKMMLSCADRSVTFVNPLPNDCRTLGNHFATVHGLVGDTALIDYRLIPDQSQIGHRYTAKIPTLFVVKPIAAPSETDLRLT